MGTSGGFGAASAVELARAIRRPGLSASGWLTGNVIRVDGAEDIAG